MNNLEFLDMATLAYVNKSVYAKGGFGYPMNATSKTRLTSAYSFNAKRADLWKNLDANTFAWDCICFIKGILWGWCADKTKPYGGAVYKSNGVPDSTIETFKKNCLNVSTDFSRIRRGEILFLGNDHVGIYMGNGMALEATTTWSKEGGIFYSAVDNVKVLDCERHRKWDCHGFIPYIDYVED